jgi:hypothetical protein
MYSQKKLRFFSFKSCKKIINSKKNINYFLKPYKHLVIDNFFDQKLINRCLKNFPNIHNRSWEFTNDQDVEIKYRSKWGSEFDIPEGIIDVVRILNGAEFLSSISEVFDIKKLIPDPYFTGGGLNLTKKGGLLDIHVDGNYHDATGLNRRLNALLFLNKNWIPKWGGEFGLYDDKGEKCLKKIEPIYNRLIVFDTHDKSWHGLPNPINFPKNKPRRSILLYYYTKEERPLNQTKIKKPHSALWKKRGGKDKKGNKVRNFK